MKQFGVRLIAAFVVAFGTAPLAHAEILIGASGEVALRPYAPPRAAVAAPECVAVPA